MRIMKEASIFFLLCFLPIIHVVADDADKGRDVYLSYCVACHAFSCNRDSSEAYSPKLAGLIGRKAGGVEDFTGYSDSLKTADIVWTEEVLHSFFINPLAVVSGITSPEFHKVKKSEEVAQLIEFLKTEDPAVDIFCTE